MDSIPFLSQISPKIWITPSSLKYSIDKVYFGKYLDLFVLTLELILLINIININVLTLELILLINIININVLTVDIRINIKNDIGNNSPMIYSFPSENNRNERSDLI